MKFDAILKQLEAKRPALKDDSKTLEFKPVNLRALLLQVYEQGHKEGEEIGRLSAPHLDSQAPKRPSVDPFDPFNGIFG